MKKIMFNDKHRLTKAVLEDLKTNTRRIVSPSTLLKAEKYRVEYFNATLDAISIEDAIKEFSLFKAGEVVAVAQSYKDRFNGAELPFIKDTAGWSNKMFVKASLMSERIRITNVRVEHLQDISDEDCLKEGIEFASGCYYTNYNKETNSRTWLGNTPKEAFAALIDKTCGRGTWDSNPFVFVYDFERVK